MDDRRLSATQRARARTLPREALLRAVHTMLWLSVPAGLLALATGVWLGVGTRWGLLRHWWVALKLAGAVAVIVTDVLVVRAGVLEAMALRESRSLYGSAAAHCVVLGLATWLSIVKPRGRTPLGRRSAVVPQRRTGRT